MSINKNVLRFMCEIALAIGFGCLVRWWHRKDVLVLVYHNIGGNDVSLEAFKKQVEFLRVHHSIISLEQLLARLGTEQECARPDLPNNSVVITFDDGQVGINKRALPILAQHRIPAAVFLTTGLVGTQDALPMERFDTWAKNLLARNKKVLIGGFIARTNSEVRALRARIKTLDQSTLQIPQGKARSDTRIVNLKEIRSMSKHKITFYPHGHSHYILSYLPKEKCAVEIQRSIGFCRKHGLNTSAFAYPNGKKNDFTEDSEVLLKEFGVAVSFSTIPGYVSTDKQVASPLPRLSMGEAEDFTSFRIRLAFGLFL